MKTFNKTKPHGKVCGGYGQAAFYQDGKYFDVHGNLLDDKGMPLAGNDDEPQQPVTTEGGDTASTGGEDSTGANEGAETEGGADQLNVDAQLKADVSNDTPVPPTGT